MVSGQAILFNESYMKEEYVRAL